MRRGGLATWRPGLQQSLRAFLLLTIVTGALFPAALWGLSQALFPRQADGSLIRRGDQVIGSELIGQNFVSSKYFWPRPSATTPTPYNAAASAGSNLGPRHPDLLKSGTARLSELRQAGPAPTQPAPLNLLTSSGSGLDPHITLASALYQVPRIAQVRSLPVEAVRRLVASRAESPLLGFMGEPYVNVLTLNLQLDQQ